MKAIIVDDERLCGEYLESLCFEVDGVDVCAKFTDAVSAVSFLKEHEIDLVFMDIEMPEMDGLNAVDRLREIRPDLGVIFVTGYEQYALQAFHADAVSYLLKPCDVGELDKAVKKASKLVKSSRKRMRINTFGNFQVFFDDIPYRFSNEKAKELLALLIDQQGGIVTMENAVSLLWEGRPYDDTVKQLYRKAVIYLNQLAKEKDLEFFVSNRGSCHIIPSQMECDCYNLFNDDADAKKRYCGEYMLDYSWAEETVGRIEHFLQ